MDNELINRIEEESEDMKRIIQEYSNGMRVVMIKNTSGIINYEITNADDSIIKFKISASDKKILSCESDCKKIIIPNNILAIGEQVFAGCRNLKEITIPESVTSIGKQAFYTCHNLTEITIPESVTSIGEQTFAACHSLKKITIPESVTSIGKQAFARCRNLTELTIPESVTSIGEQAFEACYNLTELTIPESVTSIGEQAFAGCSNLTEITIPESVTSIGEQAFEACYNLTEITIPESVTSIGKQAFYACHNLTEITIPESVTSIGDDIFQNCINLKNIYYKNFKFTPPKDIALIYENVYKKLIEKVAENNNYNITLIDKDKQEYPHNSDVSILFNSILKKVPRENQVILETFLEKFNIDNFIYNIEQLKKYNFTNENIISSIVYGNYYEFLNISLNVAEENYQYLLDENIISKEKLDELLFEDAQGNSFMEKLTYYYNDYGTLPSLFKVLMTPTENQLELRDRLKYISIACLEADKMNYSNARLMFGRTLFENISEYDKQNFFEIDRNRGEKILIKYPQMNGILEPFYKKINGIDEKWFKDLTKEVIKDNNSIFDNFFYSLNTIKNWNDIPGEQERATRLKNEIIGRILYTQLVYSNFDIYKNELDMTDKTNPAIWKSMTKNNLSIQELLQYSTKNEFDSFNINGIIIDSVQSVNLIRNLFKIDPYAFDMFKSDKEPSELEVIFAALAKENGYIFTKKEIEKYKQKLKGMNIRTASKMFKDISSDKNDIFKNQSSIEKIFDAPNRDFTEFISNNIGIPKIPSEKKLIFLNHIKMQAKKYIKNHSNAELNEFTESLDLYLRANSEYIIQSGQAQQDEISQYIYNNPNVSETDKIIYSIYNLNRLAHNSSELHLKSYLNNKYRNPYIKLDKNIDGKFKNAINGYNILSQYGIKRDIVDALLTGKYDYTNSDTILSTDAISSLNGYVTDGKEFEVLDIDKLKQIYNKLQRISVLKIAKEIKENKINIKKQPYKSINNILNKITAQYPTINFALINPNDNNNYNEQLYKLIEIEKIKTSLEKISNKELNNTTDELSKDDLKIKKILKENNQELLNQLLDTSINSLGNNINDIANKIDIDQLKEIALSLEEKNILESDFNNILTADELNLYEKAEEQKSIKKQFEKISRISNEDKIRLNTYIEEAITFYKCKIIFAEEIMNKLAKNMTTQFEDIMFADKATKQQFYAEHGFIAEVQYDESGNLVLACLSEQFNEAFSVHLQDLDHETIQKFVDHMTEPTISHVKLAGRGLTLRDESYDDSLKSLSADPNYTGFYNSYEMLEQAMRNNYDMYDLPARKLRTKQSVLKEMLDENNEKNTDSAEIDRSK